MEKEYGEGWGIGRIITVAAMSAAILGAAYFGATRDYKPTKSKNRTEYRQETGHTDAYIIQK
ncbi:MAG: hypothetical protein QW165_00780 [Candidatus Woesearchaeota archaeon]